MVYKSVSIKPWVGLFGPILLPLLALPLQGLHFLYDVSPSLAGAWSDASQSSTDTPITPLQPYSGVSPCRTYSSLCGALLAASPSSTAASFTSEPSLAGHSSFTCGATLAANSSFTFGASLAVHSSYTCGTSVASYSSLTHGATLAAKSSFKFGASLAALTEGSAGIPDIGREMVNIRHVGKAFILTWQQVFG